MGAAIDTVATKLLMDGIQSHFPCTNPGLDPEARFYVHQADYGSEEYIINDIDLNNFPRIAKSQLEDPYFDLIEWYVQLIHKEGLFRREYWADHPLPGGAYYPDCACSEHEFAGCRSTSVSTGSNDESEHDPEPEECEIVNAKTTIDSPEFPGVDLIERVELILSRCQPFPGDGPAADPRYKQGNR